MQPTSRSPLIEYKHVSVRYNEEVTALKAVSLRIEKGEFVTFIGRTGAGKSTFLKLLTRDCRETSGTVNFDGVDLATVSDWQVPALRRKMGIVPQDYALLPRKRVWENVAYAMRAVGHTRREVRDHVPRILEQVHIAHRSDAFPHELSGGEQQRVAIGRALVSSPKLIIADEPTGNLDPEHSFGIMELLAQLNRDGATILIASHDLMTLDRIRCRTIKLESGHIVGDVPAEPLYHQSAIEQFALQIDEAPSAAQVTLDGDPIGAGQSSDLAEVAADV